MARSAASRVESDRPATPTLRLADAAMQLDSTLFSPATADAPPRVCVIAEIGVNHDGKLSRAIELVEAAAASGATAIKTQLFDPRFLLSNQAKLAVYQESSATDVFDMLDGLKLGLDDLLAVRAAARRARLAFMVTPFSLENFDALRALDVDAVKIASPDAVNYPLLRLTASLGRPMIISTGTAELSELSFAAELIRRQGTAIAAARRVRDAGATLGGCLLQCVSSYPTPTEDTGLGAIGVMTRKFGLPIGYSDHTTEIITGALAVAAGACVIEKHLTYSKTASGPDHAASFEPAEFADYVKLIRHAAAMHGSASKSVRGVEADVRNVSRQSLCVKRDLAAGHTLTGDDITVKRPGTGIPASRFDEIVGRRLARGVKANELLNEADVA